MQTLEAIASIYNSIPIPTILLKADAPQFTIVTANTAFLKSTQTELSSLIETGFFHAFPMNPDDSGVRTRNIQAAFEHVLKFKEPYQIKNHRYDLAFSANQEPVLRFWKIDLYPLLDERGNIQYIVQSSEDVTYLNEEQERTELARQRDFDLFNFSPVPMWAYDIQTLKILAANHAAQKEYGYTLAEFLSLTVKELWLKEDTPALMEQVDRKVRRGLPNKATVRHIKKNGTVVYVDIDSRPLPSWGENTRIISALDVTEKKRLSDFESLEKEVLELNSRPEVLLKQVLTYYVEGIESLFPEMHCSIMGVRNARIYSWAYASLPEAYLEQIEGLSIGDKAGSCGTAAFLKQTIIATDISSDSRWDDYRQTALAFSLRACWSQPIVNSQDEVMATFAVYYKRVKKPKKDELKIIERASSLLTVILESRQYAEVLKETTFLMAQTQELACFGNWSWDILNNIVTWSDSLYSIYGLNKKEFKATFEGYQELLHPEDREMVFNKIQEVLNTHADTEFEERIIRPNGEVRYLKSWGKLKCENGKPISMIGACLDITESKKTQEKLLAGESRLRSLVDAQTMSNERYAYVNKATNDAIYDWDIVANHLDWGEAFSRVFGYHTIGTEFPLEKWIEMVHPDDIGAINASLEDVLKNTLEINWMADYRLRKGNGDYAFVEENGYILRNDDGIAIRMIGVLRDITQRREHELKIKEHLGRYNAVSKATSDAIWDYNLLTKEVIWNNGIKEIFGYDHVDGKYEWWYDHVHPEDVKRITDIVELTIKERRSRWSGEYRFRCADGTYKFVLDRGFLMFDDNGHAIRMIGAMQDITERINYIHTIEQHNRRLQDIAWAQTHLVRAPLARILAMVELLNDAEGNAAKDVELLSYLDGSAKELDSVIKDIINKSLI